MSCPVPPPTVSPQRLHKARHPSKLDVVLQPDPHHSEPGFVSQLLSGGTAAVIGRTCTAPLDRVKILMQVEGRASVFVASRGGWLSVLLRTAKDQGILSLWRGNMANLIRIFPTQALRMTIFSRLKELRRSYGVHTTQQTLVPALLSGMISGASACVLMYPLDVARTTMAAQAYQTTLTAEMRKMVREGTMFRGLLVNMVEIAPYVGVSLGSYDYMKERYAQRHHRLTAWDRLLIGTCSGILAVSTCFPLDTVRRYMIVHKVGLRGAMMQLLDAGGVRRLYRGLPVSALKAAPTAGITLMANDMLKQAFAALGH
ncbi:hypothetical protein FOZ63_033327 [Perkinsus olseni]|uniref:Solute carrier 25 n=1 Tax=Perkinsus olseni TaxID=32597 RepID=A0A7J6U7I8_PEROL|nr:hypothetical protein FOZ63_033327 [Perkinsus olseni]